MNQQKIIIAAVFLIAIILVLALSVFTVDETEQAIITQLGKFVRSVTEPGLHFKVPFIQSVHKFEDRILEYDAAAAKIITEDKKHLLVDNYARWRIVDPLKLYQTVRDEFGAQARLDDIVFSEIREELARHTLTEILKGGGDAEAIKVYAEAFEEDPEFYAFVRTLEAYEKSLRKDTTVVLPADSEFFQYLSPPTD